MKMPTVQQEYFPLGGGLDLVSPQIALNPGVLFDAQNYEPDATGGYSRIDGYERFDGRTSPTAAGYWLMEANITGALAVGNTITGLTSSATAKVLEIVGSNLIIGRLTGLFVVSEALQVGGTTRATSTSTAQISGENSPSNDADYMLLAANDRRADIAAVPGSGPIRGVAIYQDVVYAFRDNVGGTAGTMWKSTSGGWVQVTFGTEIQFTSATGGTTPIAVGATIGNLAAPTKTATVLFVLTRSGTWGTDAAGTLIVAPVTGSFSAADSIFVGATQKGVAATGATAITRLPGGAVETVNANFTGSTLTLKMYGADGVNLGFEFNGTHYVPIRTGMATDTPSHVFFHRFTLFYSFRGSVQFSAIGNPYGWTLVLGAGEIGVSDDISGFLSQGGSATGSTLAIFTKSKVFMLYGSSSANFNLVMSNSDIGYLAGTMQAVSNNAYGMTARGLQSLAKTQEYGDFAYAAISQPIQPLIASLRGMETTSVTLKTKDQYRIYFSNGSGLIVGLSGNEVTGIMPINYGRPVRCIATQTLANGKEQTVFGSDDGFVYQDSTGTSFDGGPIEAWIRPAFNHSKSPQIRKRYRRAVFEIKPFGFSKVDVSYDLGYGNPEGLVPSTSANNNILGGGYWDQFIFESFIWDTRAFTSLSIALTGTEKNISFLFYSNRAQDQKHTVQGLTLQYTAQRLER